MLAIASMVMLNVACDDKQETLPVVMTLTSSSVMDIDDKGGELVITYELTNVSSTENLQIITAADWIYVKDKSAVGRIELMIDANHEESNRMAPVIVTYADQRFDDLAADARIALRKRVCAEQHHRAGGFLVQRFADGDAVREDQVFLKLRALVA